MYLADTSAWIEFGRRQPRAIGQRLRALIAADAAVFVCDPVVQEVLQGARDESTFERMRGWLLVQRYAQLPDPATTHVEAALLYARCRWRGLTPRSGADCLIARIAVEHQLILLHDDGDFLRIAQVEPRLKLA